ncbi:NUDIX hydrolase [Saccharomonospora viridis]|uniref:NUDIX hydrolase n=1 Tax=Saccharomonospora viridis TaxID=1852 RepID=UPI002409A40C|nr:NUDIX hydrolase [Saccharomonospora viridis]
MFDEENHEAIRLTADAVVFAPDENGVEHVLLIRRRWEPFEGMWALPGGHVDQGEEAVDAAARELQEETGVVAPFLTELAAWHGVGRDPRGRYVTVAFLVWLSQMVAPVAEDDAVEAAWIPVHEALDLGLAFDHSGIVATALASRSFARGAARAAV